MPCSLHKVALLAAAVMYSSGIASAQSTVDVGKREYDANCAACHGPKGKGDGSFLLLLAKKDPADLTTLAKRNNGTFPFQRVYEVIDGRQEIKTHGPRDMPIWGVDYQLKAAEQYRMAPSVDYDPSVFIRARILALIDYLNRLQVK